MLLSCNIENHLWSVCYHADDRPADILQELFDKWTDPSYIDLYVEEHKGLLQSEFFSEYTIEDIKRAIYDEACNFERFLVKLCENTMTGRKPDLDQTFRNLEDKSTDYPLIRQKMYGKRAKSNPPSFLRLYAVRIEPNVYVLTGGAIKLVREMHESEETLRELNRLKDAWRELERYGIKDIDGLYYLETEDYE